MLVLVQAALQDSAHASAWVRLAALPVGWLQALCLPPYLQLESAEVQAAAGLALQLAGRLKQQVLLTTTTTRTTAAGQHCHLLQEQLQQSAR